MHAHKHTPVYTCISAFTHTHTQTHHPTLLSDSDSHSSHTRTLHTPEYTHMHTHTYICTHSHLHSHICTYTAGHTHLIYTPIHTSIREAPGTHTCPSPQCAHIPPHAHTHICKHAFLYPYHNSLQQPYATPSIHTRAHTHLQLPLGHFVAMTWHSIDTAPGSPEPLRSLVA